jgi:hypothetical protein
MLPFVFFLLVSRQLCSFPDDELRVGVLNLPHREQWQALLWRDELYPLQSFNETDTEFNYEFAEQLYLRAERKTGLMELLVDGATRRQCFLRPGLKPLRQHSKALDKLLSLSFTTVAQLNAVQDDPIKEATVLAD